MYACMNVRISHSTPLDIQRSVSIYSDVSDSQYSQYVHIYFFVSTSHNWMENNRKFRYKIVAIEACIHYLLSFREM